MFRTVIIPMVAILTIQSATSFAFAESRVSQAISASSQQRANKIAGLLENVDLAKRNVAHLESELNKAEDASNLGYKSGKMIRAASLTLAAAGLSVAGLAMISAARGNGEDAMAAGFVVIPAGLVTAIGAVGTAVGHGMVVLNDDEVVFVKTQLKVAKIKLDRAEQQLHKISQ